LHERLAAEPSITSVAGVDVESALARLETQAGRPTEAKRWAERAVAGQAARVGTEHPAYADALLRLGAAQEQRSELAEARVSFEQALAIHDRLGNETAALGVHNSLAIVLERQGDFDAAAREYAIALQAATEQHMDDFVSRTRVNLGSLELARDDPEAAIEHLTIARTLAEGIYPADHDVFVSIHYGLGVAHGRRGEAERAVAHLERALELSLLLGMSTGKIGRHRSVLGQARWRLPEPGARARARDEVERGRAELESDPEAYTEEIAEADAWLKSHRLDPK
jgi:tetratricopeptide (TPR) repeat protein